MRNNLVHKSLFLSSFTAMFILAACGREEAPQDVATQNSVTVNSTNQQPVGCASISSPIPFRGTNVFFDGRTVTGGQFRGSTQTYGGITIGGSQEGSKYKAESDYGSVALDVTPTSSTTQYNYGYAVQYANIVGTLTLSASAQGELLARMGGGQFGYNSPYNNPNGYNSYNPYGNGGYNQYAPTPGYNQGYPTYGGQAQPISNACISNLAFSLQVAEDGTAHGTVEAFVSNSQVSTILRF